MSDHERTTQVTLTITATFIGDYYEAGDVASHLKGWIDGAMDDRPDLYSWTFGLPEVTELNE